MIANGYCTEAQFREWTQLEGTAKVAMIENAIEAMSRSIDEYCDRHFYQDGTSGTPVARLFKPCNRYDLDLGDFNDLSTGVTPTIATDTTGDGTVDTTWSSDDFELLPVNRAPGRPYTRVRAIGSKQFPSWYGVGPSHRLQITGVWGWDAVPPQVSAAIKLLAAKYFTRHQSPHGMAGLTGVGDFGAIRISKYEDPDVARLLDPLSRTGGLLVA
jgi:hypothetical protein